MSPQGFPSPAAPRRIRSLLPLVLMLLATTWLATEAKDRPRARGAAAAPLNWQALGEPGVGGTVTGMAVSPSDSNRILIGGDILGVGVSEDGAQSWQPTFGFASWEIADFTFNPSNAKEVWVGTMSGPYVSEDAGHTWQASSTGLPQGANPQSTLSSSFEAIVVALTNPSLLYTSDIAYNEAGIFRSSDGGATWQAVMNSTLKANAPTAFVSGPGFTVLAMDPSNSQSVYAAGAEYALASHDGGATWSDATSKPVAGTTRWQGRGYEGFVAVNFAFNPQQPGFAVLLGMDDGKFWQSRDGLSSWQWGGAGLDHWGGGNDVTFTGAGGSTMYVTFGQDGTYSGIGKTTDGGQTWTVLAGSAQGLPALNASSEQAMGVYALPTNPNQVWATIGGQLYSSTDGGATWQVIHNGPGLEWIAADPVNPLTFQPAPVPPAPSPPQSVTVSVYAGSGGILHTSALSVTVN